MRVIEKQRRVELNLQIDTELAKFTQPEIEESQRGSFLTPEESPLTRYNNKRRDRQIERSKSPQARDTKSPPAFEGRNLSSKFSKKDKSGEKSVSSITNEEAAHCFSFNANAKYFNQNRLRQKRESGDFHMRNSKVSSFSS